MADKLIFPIGFDLESGLKTAESDLKRVARQLENAIKKQSIKVPVGLDEATAKKLREEAKDIERVLANIKNNYGSGQLKGLSIGFINTQKEIDGIKKLETQLQALKAQRTSLVNAGATIEELNRIDAAIRGTELRLKILYQAFNKDQSSNVAISQQIVKLKQLAEELAGIDRMYARMQASAAAANKPVNSYEVNEMLARRREIMEEITRVTKTATEAQKELFNIKGVGVGASQGIFGVGGEQALSAITQQISRYEELKNKLREVEGEYERLKAMQAQGMGDQSAAINQALQRRIAIQKELGEITQTAAQAQKELEKKAQATAAAFQRGRGAIENFNRVMKLPENRIMNIQQKINLLNQALKRVGIGSTEFNKIVAELTRLGQKLDEAKAKQEAFAGTQKKVGEAGSKAFREQSSYLNILIKRLAVYTSLDAVMGFLTKVREVTAQFELQRISLGAIINDQTRANQLFNEIKQFALKSPIKILDLTKYTKQLAAFRFETDTLFDTTKRVADISVGLSVPMDRLILALGHVKASTYLTGITLRQFSMAGIPMLELLAERFSELEGRAVSTTDVLKRVHDKMVSFEDVNQIFINLTSSGGMFYNMQEKQGNTLYGMWAKLGDAASVMYDQIGNTASVNKAMKEAIDMLTVMMRNWRDVGRVITEAGVAFGVYRLAVLASAKATALSTAWNAKDVALRQMHLKTVMAQSMHVRNFNRVLLASGVSAQKASTATWVFSRALNGLKGAIATTGIGALIIGLGLLVDKLLFSKSAAQQLKETLDNIETESVQEQDKSVRNFERLANIAVSAASTYKEQQEALEELKRTYKDIIPQERLTIENLKEMNGNYELLTASIRTYISERMKQKQTDEIINTYAYEILKIQRKINNELKNKYSAEQLAEFWKRYTEIVKDSSKSAGKSIAELINMTVSAMGADMQFAHDLGSVWSLWAHDHADISRMTTLIREQETQINALGKTYDATAMAMGEFAKSYNEAVAKITENGVKLNGVTMKQEDNPLLYAQQEANLEIKDAMVPTIKEAFKEAGLAFDEGWTNLKDNVDKNMPQLTSTIDFEPMIQKSNEEAKKLLAALQTQLDTLVAQREAYMKQIRAEEGKGKGKNDDFIKNTKAQYDSIGEQIADLESRAKKINAVFPLLDTLKKKYNNIVPSDSVVKLMRQRFDQIVDYTKSYAINMRRFRMNADEDMEAYRKRLTDEVKLIKNNIKAWSAAMVLARLFRNKTEEQNLQNLIDEAKLQLADLEKILGEMPVFDTKGSGKSDPRLGILQEMVNTLKQVNKEYDELAKKEGATKALEDTARIYQQTFDKMKELSKQYNFELPKFGVPTDTATLTEYLKAVKDAMAKLPKSDKVVLALQVDIEKLKTDELQKQIEQKLKELSDRISRAKTAKEFYDRILNTTGDYDLAANVSMSIYGDTGAELQQQMAEQIREMFAGYDVEVPVSVITDDNNVDYLALEKYVKEMQDKLGGVDSKTYQELLKIAQEGQRNLAKTYEGYLKDLEKAKTYSDKRIELARYTANKITEIEQTIADAQNKLASLRASGKTDDETNKEIKRLENIINSYKSLPQQYKEREDKEAAKLEYEAFKNSALYVQMFEDLDFASTKALTRMRDRLIALKSQWKNLDPTQLKELQKRLKEIDEQIAARNPFKSIGDAFKKWRDLRKSGRTKESDELKAEQAEQARIAAEAKMLADEKAYQAAQAAAQAASEEEKPALEAAAQAARETADASKEAYDNAEQTANDTAEAANEWKDIVDAIAKANQKIEQYQAKINEALDGVRKMLVAFGTGDIDMQFFDDIVSGFNEIVDAGQDAIMSAASFMSGDILGGITSGVSAIGGLISGFIGLFNAGAIRRANKEIEHQQKILDQLEYSYGRLEKAAEKAFGGDYIRNMEQQEKNLQAQAEAYRKQAEAERSKGKDADEDKIKEYENAYRDTMDKIAELHGKVAEKFLGTDLTSAARDFAKAWLDAYKEFGNTADKMSEKFHEMIENMIVESLLGKVMEQALKPMFDMVDNMGEQDFYSESFWRKVASTAKQGAEDADKGAQLAMKYLEQAGLSIRSMNSDFTGIAKNISSATSEEINRAAAIGNTLMYYVSPIPTISENVAMIRAIMEGRNTAVTAPTVSKNIIDTTLLQNEAMNHLAMIERYTGETAIQLTAITSLLNRIVVNKGGQFGVNSFYKT